MKTVLMVIGLCILVASLVFVVGPCVYYGFIDKPGIEAADYSVPCREDASHSFYIENTGKLFYASDFEVTGSTPGKRIIILHGYYDLRGNKFILVKELLPLDESIFGPVEIKERTKD